MAWRSPTTWDSPYPNSPRGAKPSHRMRPSIWVRPWTIRCVSSRGAPEFAVEVRSENDYGEAAEAKMATKRADYFQAGTLVVWDVDPSAQCVWKYQATSPDQPIRFNRGDQADAEPAVPGWRMSVDRMFR